MKVVESQGNLGGVELGNRVGEALLSTWDSKDNTHLTLPEQAEQLSTRHKVHDHVKVVDVLESAPEVDEEWVPHTNEHLALRVGVLYLLHLDDLLLVENLDRIKATIVLGTD